MKLSRSEARVMGLVLPPAPRSKTSRKMPEDRAGAVAVFDAVCEAHGLPRPVHEFEFAAELGRRWRFDYLWGWLAVERVGGVWTGGHHSRGRDQIDDMEKFNTAVQLGYSVLQFTPQQFDDGSAFAVIKMVLESHRTNNE